MRIAPKHFILDVDGVMTDGKLYYTKSGKAMKVFGPDDHDALSLLKPHLGILFVSGDHRGFAITKKRIVGDMKMPLELVSTVRRIDWISERFDPKEVIYMGDGIFDPYVFARVGYSIATADADAYARRSADFVTERKGAERAVAEASLHILARFFTPFNRAKLPPACVKASGKWSI
ncbi:MAG: hypothetical protein WCW52_00965 [Elusimicrobiales bacterium]|jgi:3-deoxy-D-manno-octulosonate 8-phosphate phosphatase (KDO 8-P phosphatase)